MSMLLIRLKQLMHSFLGKIKQRFQSSAKSQTIYIPIILQLYFPSENGSSGKPMKEMLILARSEMPLLIICNGLYLNPLLSTRWTKSLSITSTSEIVSQQWNGVTNELNLITKSKSGMSDPQLDVSLHLISFLTPPLKTSQMPLKSFDPSLRWEN